MDLRKKVYRMFVLSPAATELEQGGNLEIALGSGLGGVILFTKNIISVEQTKKLNDDISKVSYFPVFKGIDQEGGRVERTENIFGGKKFLSVRYQAQKGVEFVKEQTKEIAELIKQMGFNMNFAPVLDVDTNPQNPIIGERAYADNAQDVSKYGIAAMKTYLDNGIIPVGKHFPGHGGVNADSHLTLPVLDLSLDEMEQVHIKPFKDAVEAGLPAIMAAHLYCTCFDKETMPASLSNNVLGYLREKLGFNGLVVSDDMAMGGVGMFDTKDAVLMGIKAGINLFLFRDCSDETIEVIENTIIEAQKDPYLRNKIDEAFEIIDRIIKT